MSFALVALMLSAVALAHAKTIVVRFGPLEQWPPVLRVTAKDCVVWHNNGRGVHGVRAQDGSFDSGFLTPGEQYEQCFFVDGVVAYGDPVYPAQNSIVVVGDVPFNAPPQAGRTTTRATVSRGPLRPVTTAPATAAPGVLIGATNVDYLVPNDPLASAADARNVVVRGTFSGSMGRGSAVAVITDGCNSVRSPAETVVAGDVDLPFGPLDVRSLDNTQLRILIEVDGEPYEGPTLLKQVTEDATPLDAAPVLNVVTVSYDQL